MKVDYFWLRWPRAYIFIKVPDSNDGIYPFTLSKAFGEDESWMIDSIL